jgi:uncharacterized protein (DUF305 family)
MQCGRSPFPVRASLFFLFATASLVANGPAPTERQSRFEIRFMESMMDHHLGGVEMAHMCVEKALHPELRDLCQMMISDQSAEIQQMQSWLQSWYAVNYIPKSSKAGMNHLERMSGAEFEVEFMMMMSKHHAGAIRDSADCLLNAFHQELRALCQQMISTQAREIAVLRTWLCQWHSRCEPV